METELGFNTKQVLGSSYTFTGTELTFISFEYYCHTVIDLFGIRIQRNRKTWFFNFSSPTSKFKLDV